jgi:hypothetical protein
LDKDFLISNGGNDYDETLKIWNSTGTCIQSIVILEGRATSFVNKKLCVASAKKAIEVWKGDHSRLFIILIFFSVISDENWFQLQASLSKIL